MSELRDLIDYVSRALVDMPDSVEVKETSFRMDGVFVPPNPSGTVYFCEVQFLWSIVIERVKL